MPVIASGQTTIIDANDGLSLILSQTSHVFATDMLGSGGDYSGAKTTLSILLGGLNTTASWTISAVPSAGVTGALLGAEFSVSAMSSDTGYVDFTAARSGFASLTARFSLAKTRQGGVGPTLTLTPSATGFTFTDGVAQPAAQSIVIRAIRQNLTEPVQFYASNGSTLQTNLGAVGPMGFALMGDGDTCFVELSHLGAADQMYVTAVCGAATQVVSLIRINKTTAAAGATRNVFRGDWAASQTYALGDIVVDRGSSWTCSAQHISSLATQPPVYPATLSTYWVLYAARGLDGTNGANGRGTIQAAVATAGSVWSDTQANAAIVAAGGLLSTTGDVVTLYNSAISFSQTRVFSGGVWNVLAAYFGGNVLVDGTLTAEKLNTASLNVAGVGIFGGSLQSSNFITNVSGWKISHNGTLEVQNLIDRNALTPNAVSDRSQVFLPGPFNINTNTTITLASTASGASQAGDIRMWAAAFVANNAWGSLNSVVSFAVYMRYIDLGVATPWVAMGSASIPRQSPGFKSFNFSGTVAGIYDNIELMIQANANSLTGNLVGFCKNVSLAFINLVK